MLWFSEANTEVLSF